MGTMFKFIQNCAASPSQAGCSTPVTHPNIYKRDIQEPNLVNFMTSRQAKLQQDTYFRVMRILQENPDLTQRELAERLGVSVGGLNYCLKALMEKGLVKMQNFSQSKNKFGYVYILTPSGMAEKTALASWFLKRKLEEYEALKAEIEALKSEADSSSTIALEALAGQTVHFEDHYERK